MALIACPECQREISDEALMCPQCGYPLAETKLDQAMVQMKVELLGDKPEAQIWKEMSERKAMLYILSGMLKEEHGKTLELRRMVDYLLAKKEQAEQTS